MNDKVVFILTTIFPAFALAQEGLMCYEPGECQGGSLATLETTTSYNECLESCNGLSTCEYLTYNKDNDFCALYWDCPDLSTAFCNNCHSGQKGLQIENVKSVLLISQIQDVPLLRPAT